MTRLETFLILARRQVDCSKNFYFRCNKWDVLPVRRSFGESALSGAVIENEIFCIRKYC